MMPSMHNTDTNGRGAQSRPDGSKAQVMIWQIIRTLSQIDADYNLRLDELERSPTAEEVKGHVRQKLRAEHRQQREPYVTQLEELRQQQRRQSFAA
jgi:hypothetical protein